MMYATCLNEIDENDLLYEPEERTSDIQFPSAMNFFLLMVWLVACVVGFAVTFLAKNAVAGAAIIAVPTFVGMVLKPTFA
ncbi:MAG: hypothetical protein JW741_10285, partial [Sedimentisphaerales bacterium]|nr:hypothetical protein [Sedimentisphaerales bacterium]